MDAAQLMEALARFSGTRNYHTHWSGAFRYTDGVAFLAENTGSYWLLDLIASWQKKARKDRMLREFQIWVLRVEGKTGVVECLRDTDDVAFEQHVPFTDFSLKRIKLYLEDKVLMLPNEL